MTRHTRLLAALTLGLMVATPIGAGAADTSVWKLDGAKSQLSFSGTQIGKKFDGKFTRYQAAISFDPDHPEQGRIVVDVDLASAVTGDPQRDSALPGKEWFDVADFPRARFESASIRKVSGNSFEASGTLTLRGATHPLTLPFTLDVNGTTAHAKGHASLVRTTFGIGQGAWASDQWVAFDVGIDIDLSATKGE